MKIALSPLLKNSLNFESYKFVLLRPNFKKEKVTKGVRFLRITLTLLMVAYLSAVSYYKHIHIVDSEIVAHSHPYQNDTHKHNISDFSFYQSLSNIETEVSFLSVDCAPNFGKNSEIILLQVLFCEQFFTRYYSLRAPPALKKINSAV